MAQLTHPERGFSFQGDAPLDMRMDRSQGPTASDFVNELAEKDLADLFHQLGEERRARRVSRAIVRARPIRSTAHLTRVVEAAVPRADFRLHPATKVFMALRIAVNRELEELDALMDALPRVLAPGGRAVLLTFHSGEDRRVKLAFRRLAQQGRAKLLTKHVVRPADEEIRLNPASRSAKLRALLAN
jgi:16S rRNA (cytosine1402-N4)-methyltransferase